jgi:hypothetical protein
MRPFTMKRFTLLTFLLLTISAYAAEGPGEKEQQNNPEAAVSIISVKRSPRNPLVTPESSTSLGHNLNGPSVIRVPPWVKSPLGKYYLYFAHHQGPYIRLAYADTLDGPWTIYEPGTLKLSEITGWGGHIASPDVHVDEEKKVIRMYFHADRGGQRNGSATSTDGIHFKVSETLPGGWYFRVFAYGGVYYGIDRSGDLYRSKDPMGPFEKRRECLMPREIRDKKVLRQVRHTAVLRKDDLLLVFFSRTGDTPERILLSTVQLSDDWNKWVLSKPIEVIQPETDYEGIKYPLKTSTGGVAPKQARELRDPYVFEEDGRYFLFYTISGEAGIAMAEVELGMKAQQSDREATSAPAPVPGSASEASHP